MAKEENNELELDMSSFGEDFELVDPIEEEIIDSDKDQDKDDNKDSNDDQNKGDDQDLEKDKNGDSDDDQEESVADKDKLEKDSSDESESPSQKLYSSLASALAEEGIISSLDDPIKSPEDLFNVIKNEIKKNEFSDLTEDQKEYLVALRAGVPVEEYKQTKSFESKLEQLTEEDLESSEELRKSIIIQDYMNQGMSQEKSEKLAQRAIDLSEDLNEAKEALGSIKQFTKAQLQKRIEDNKAREAQMLKKQQDDLKALKKQVDSLKEVIPGVQVNEKVKNQIYDSMTKTVGKTPDGKPLNALTKARMENPSDFTIKLHYLFNVTNGFKNFDKIVKTSKSKAVKELDDLLKGNTFIPSGQQSQENMDFDIDDKMKLVIDNL